VNRRQLERAAIVDVHRPTPSLMRGRLANALWTEDELRLLAESERRASAGAH